MAPVTLIGYGLDAIVYRTRAPLRGLFMRLLFRRGVENPRLPVVYLPTDRLQRYEMAKAALLPQLDHAGFQLRAELGAQYQRAWRDRKFPNFRAHTQVVSLNERRARRSR